jgi:hypothetical protein
MFRESANACYSHGIFQLYPSLHFLYPLTRQGNAQAPYRRPRIQLFLCEIDNKSSFAPYSRATPEALAASRTAFATAFTTLSSRALGRI